MHNFRFLAPLALLAALAGCGGGEPPPQLLANAVTLTAEQGGRFLAFVGPRRQHAPPFLGVPNTNFYALRSWIDTRSGETVHQLYVENSYAGAERNFNAAHDGEGQPLKFVPISKNEISCENGCSYAEEFAAALPEPLLRASPQGLKVVFGSKLGLNLTIALPGEFIAGELAAVDTTRAHLPKTAGAAAAAPPSPATAAADAAPPATAAAATTVAAPTPPAAPR